MSQESLEPPKHDAEFSADIKPVPIGTYLQQGWQLFWKNPGFFIVYTAIIMIANIVMHSIPLIGQLAALLLSGPLIAGYYYAYRKQSSEPVELKDFAKGFDNAVPLILVGAASSILISLGFIFFLLPGIYLAISYLFAIPMVIDQEIDFWQAMERSRRFVGRQWFNWFGLGLVLFVVLIAGMIPAGLGTLISLPFIAAVIVVAYDDQLGWKK